MSMLPARIARAAVVSAPGSKNLTEMCWTLTFPPHQCGLAESSRPVVALKLSSSHGPLAMIPTPVRVVKLLLEDVSLVCGRVLPARVGALQRYGHRVAIRRFDRLDRGEREGALELRIPLVVERVRDVDGGDLVPVPELRAVPEVVDVGCRSRARD